MLSIEIKHSTSQSHVALEKEFVQHIKATKTIEAYINLLSILHGYYGALEELVGPYLTSITFPDFEKRRKASLLINDIKTFSQPTAKYWCHALPAVNSFHQALGAMYVMEGSTLGGRIIAGIITRQLQLNSPEGLSFFHGYGQKTDCMWERFREILNQPFGINERDEIQESAQQTFITFKNWIQAHAK